MNGLLAGTGAGLRALLATACLLLRAQASPLEARMREQGLVGVRQADASIRVDLKYATQDNFMHADVYQGLTEAYLQPEAAEKLAKAQALLKRRRPGHSLKVFDGARPLSVQRTMWALVKGTPMQPYVANPAGGSVHNYGCAVDLTLVDGEGRELDMGTPYDHLGELAQPRLEARFLAEGRLTSEQVAHRRLLREVMVAAGFQPISNEWWHFDAVPRAVAKTRYRILP